MTNAKPIRLDPKVVAQCRLLDAAARDLQRIAFRNILIAFAIYFVALGLTIFDKIPTWLMYTVLAGTLLTLWHANKLTSRAHRNMYKSFRLIDAEFMRLLREVFKND